MNITEDYVSFETAKLLKENGFNEELDMVYSEYGVLHKIFDLEYYNATYEFDTISNSHYNNVTKNKYDFFATAPTIQMTLKWLRENHDIYIIAEPHSHNGSHADTHVCTYWYNGNFYRPYEEQFPQYHKLFGKVWQTQEEAYDEVIRYCLEYLI